MKKIILIILFIPFTTVFSQNIVKVDSTFNHYFKALELEISEKKDPGGIDSEFYEEVTLGNNEKAYVNIYANEAIVFLEKITKINAPEKISANTIAHYVDKITLKKWKQWYDNNKYRIKWCEKKQKPYMPFFRRIFG